MKTLTIIPKPGDDIEQTVISAILLAKDTQRRINFRFNDTWMWCEANSSVEQKLNRWKKQRSIKQRDYDSLLSTKSRVLNRKLVYLRDQVRIDIILDTLEHVVDNEYALLSWLYKYTELADNIFIEVKKDYVLQTLLNAGWIKNAYVGVPKTIFDTPSILAAYIVGQAIRCLKANMSPHPILLGLVEKYKSMICHQKTSYTT